MDSTVVLPLLSSHILLTVRCIAHACVANQENISSSSHDTQLSTIHPSIHPSTHAPYSFFVSLSFCYYSLSPFMHTPRLASFCYGSRRMALSTFVSRQCVSHSSSPLPLSSHTYFPLIHGSLSLSLSSSPIIESCVSLRFSSF